MFLCYPLEKLEKEKFAVLHEQTGTRLWSRDEGAGLRTRVGEGPSLCGRLGSPFFFLHPLPLFSKRLEMNLVEIKVLVGLAISGKLPSFWNLYWRKRVGQWFKYFCATRLQHLKFRHVQYGMDGQRTSPCTEMEEVSLGFRTRFCCLPFKVFEFDRVRNAERVAPRSHTST